MPSLRERIAGNRVAAPLAAFPVRLGLIARFDARVLGQSVRWLVRSREHTNFTYDLTALGEEQLAWWVAAVCSLPVDSARAWIRELHEDDELRQHVRQATAGATRRGLADPEVRYARRLGWYALTRALRPQHVLETGTDKGLGSVIFAAALLRNGTGRLTTVDVNPASGYLIGGRYADVVDHVIGDSIAAIRGLETPVDLSLHDSLRLPEHEASEYVALSPKLSSTAVVLSNHLSHELPEWSQTHGRHFLYYTEYPADHWYRGSGIGASWQT